MRKVIPNASGDIVVRSTGGVTLGCGIVEILHLWDENTSGCVIAYYRVRQGDGADLAELVEVHDRLTTTRYDSAEVLLEALQYGRRLANLLVESHPD